MAEYSPTYAKTAPLTIEHFEAQLETLQALYAYATGHDDVMALDELFCAIVALEHRLILWDREQGQQPRVATSLKELNRALKWAWLAREEEVHAGGMYGGKLKEAIAVLQDLYLFLDTVRREGVETQAQTGMTHDEAEALAALIKQRLPRAEVEAKSEDGSWVVEARNPVRGTRQVFHNRDEFEHLMQHALRQHTPPHQEHTAS